MPEKFKFPAFLILIILLAVSGSLGCGSSDKTDQSDDNGADSQGRVISPDSDWERADTGDDSDGDDSDGDDSDGVDDDGNDGSGGPPNTKIFEAGTVEFSYVVDGIRQPINVPLVVYDRTTVDMEFRLTATGSELARYAIDTAARVNIPHEGILSEMNATVPFIFTYDSETWGDTGITIKVLNRNGEYFEANLQLNPAQIPGYNPR